MRLSLLGYVVRQISGADSIRYSSVIFYQIPNQLNDTVKFIQELINTCINAQWDEPNDDNEKNMFKNLLLTTLILLDSTRIQSNLYPLSRLTSFSTQAPALLNYPRNTITHGVISALLVSPLPVHLPTTLFTPIFKSVNSTRNSTLMEEKKLEW